MRKYVFVFWVLILIMVTACYPSTQQSSLPTKTSALVSEEQPIATYYEAEPTITTMVIGSSEPIAVAIDQNIPDIVIDSAQKANSNYTLYEDTDYIYYLHGEGWVQDALYCIYKIDGSVDKIADDCMHFTAHGGKVYYVDSKAEENADDTISTINEYDVQNAERRQVLKFDGDIGDIAFYDNKLYFISLAEYFEEGYELNEYDVLYSINLTNDSYERVGVDVSSFCFYNNRLFYVSWLTEGGLLCELLPDGDKNILYDKLIDWVFDISNDKIVINPIDDFNYGNSLAYDIKSGDIREMRINNHAYLAGQYMVFYEYDNDIPVVLKVYDFVDDKEYMLLDFSDSMDLYSSVEIHTTKYHIYLCIENINKKELDMYKVNIEGGKANLEHVASLKND